MGVERKKHANRQALRAIIGAVEALLWVKMICKRSERVSGPLVEKR